MLVVLQLAETSSILLKLCVILHHQIFILIKVCIGKTKQTITYEKKKKHSTTTTITCMNKTQKMNQN